jgi:hypothetical protein
MQQNDQSSLWWEAVDMFFLLELKRHIVELVQTSRQY